GRSGYCGARWSLPSRPIRDATKTPRTCASTRRGAHDQGRTAPHEPAGIRTALEYNRPAGARSKGSSRRMPGLAPRPSPRLHRALPPAARPRGAGSPGDRRRGGLAMPRWRKPEDDDPGLSYDPDDADWPDEDEPTIPCPRCRREILEDAEWCP